MKKLNVIGEKYGKLVIFQEHSTTRNGHRRFSCQCECGNTTNVLLTHLRQGNTMSCGCDIPIGKAHKQWNGIGEMSGAFWYDHIIKSSNGNKKRRKIELNITKEYVWELFLKQNKKCALSGIILKFPERAKDKSWTASLDRIDNCKGYIEGNVQWLHKDVNMLKRTYSQKYLIELCKLITKNNI